MPGAGKETKTKHEVLRLWQTNSPRATDFMGDILFEPQTEGCFCTPDNHHRLNFHCGAWLYCGGPLMYKKGTRLIVWASKRVGGADTPKTMEGAARCLFGCPCRTKAGRKQIRAWGSQQEPSKDDPGFVVSCKIESIDKPSLCIECRKYRCKTDEDELCSHCWERNRSY